MKRALITCISAALVVGALSSCGTGSSDDSVCSPGSSICFVYSEFVLVCRDDGSAWDAEPCPEGSLCFEGSCQELECVPGATECRDEGVATCVEDGTGWSDPVAWEPPEVCIDGDCLEGICTPGELRCSEDGDIERCDASGTDWETHAACPEGMTCVDDEVCLPDGCESGQTECGPTTLYTCDESGEWVGEPCPPDQPCIFGRCVECVSDSSCEEGMVCEDGVCTASAPEITTTELPPATVGAPYEVLLEVEGGLGPYSWGVVVGTLPAGLEIMPDGRIIGTPTEAGSADFTVQVTDAPGAADDQDLELQVFAEGPVRITTTELPIADHGLPYEFTLGATGGVHPYAWQLLEGALPVGLSLGSDGTISGVPDEIGTFPITLRVLDGSTPPGYDAAELELEVRVSPLEIYGGTEYDLLLLKVIILPILVPIIPYSTDLQARGGIEPYAWSIEDPPTGLTWLISEWGIPDGMTLGERGRLAGWVTDVSDAQRISIPFGPELAGYFFYGRVVDSQESPDSDEAIFCIPTVAL